MQNSLSLDTVKSHFDHWRTTRTKLGKIPETLWDMVKQIVPYYPLTKITKTLSINTTQIKDNLDQISKINFIEVNMDALPVSQPTIETLLSGDAKACAIELHRTNGSILKISAFPIISLNAIIAQFIE